MTGDRRLGDVLSGVVGALLAAGLDPWLATGSAAFVRAATGMIGRPDQELAGLT
jgi:NAD(P)H-hydrate repair Nnr-like enzyme with NAD(P)H-hydrate dehydratase domain